MDEITVHGGIRGTRILANALAKLIIANKGWPDKYPASDLRRPWTPEEKQRAKSLRLKGYTFLAIGANLGRTKSAVHCQIARRSAAPNSATHDQVRGAA